MNPWAERHGRGHSHSCSAVVPLKLPLGPSEGNFIGQEVGSGQTTQAELPTAQSLTARGSSALAGGADSLVSKPGLFVDH